MRLIYVSDEGQDLFMKHVTILPWYELDSVKGQVFRTVYEDHDVAEDQAFSWKQRKAKLQLGAPVRPHSVEEG